MVLAAVAGLALAVLVATNGVGTAQAASASVNVGDGGLRYTPNHVAVNAGETVTWTWVGGFHDVVSNNGAFTSGAPQRASGQTFTNTFTTPGTFWYYCSVHAKVEDANEQGLGAGKMVGSVTVLPGQPGAAGQQTQATATPTATRTATATATATAAATPAATPATTATPSAPKTGSAGLASSTSGAAGMAVLWTAVAAAMLIGGRAVSRRR
jgi:plastocyanin